MVDRPLVSISQRQLVEFQEMHDAHGFNIITNARPVQHNNKRVVRRSFYPAKDSRKYKDDSDSAYGAAEKSSPVLVLAIMSVLTAVLAH